MIVIFGKELLDANGREDIVERKIVDVCHRIRWFVETDVIILINYRTVEPRDAIRL